MRHVLLLLVLLPLTGCALFDFTDGDTLAFDGTVTYVTLEGGVWVIEPDDDDDETYLPTNLPDSYREEGLRVRVRAEESAEQASIYMFGTMIDIEHIERL